jgi:ABC-2 type transport system ATP-binding protein
MNASNGTIIQTHGLTKTFKGVNALQSLNLNVRKNSIFGFLGPNGAGKTTTIKLLLGLSRPTSGSASIFGLDMVRDSTRIRRRVGYLAQEPHYYEHLTARQTLRFAARFFYTGPQKAIEDRIQNTLDLVGLEDKADRPIKGFSGGERAASLDPMGRRDVLEVMERLRKHTTIFYSTHILSDVQRVSDTVAILKKGQLIAEAPIETLLAGSGGAVYSIVVKGQSNGLQADLSSLPWVSSVSSVPGNNGRTTWQVNVTDEAAAESQLLPRLICNEHLTIVEFGRKKYELEEVFMNIVEGGEHGR